MLELIAIGFVAGIVAGISPCILPVLPVILFAGATTPCVAARRVIKSRNSTGLPSVRK